jgi:hypothetical protein
MSVMLERLRHRTEPFRALIAGALIALTVLAGIAQARAMGEAGLRNGFANHLTLCLQNGADGSLPSVDHDCDACRIPATFALPALGPAVGIPQHAALSPIRVAELSARLSTYRATPPSRGPPAGA